MIHDIDYFLAENLYSASEITYGELEGVLTLRNRRQADKEEEERKKKARENMGKLQAWSRAT